ncbi:peptidyl-prolyl cis-trans isomerase [Geodermatophilus sp. TF02-6]|uniref:peptidyl-prolyl cis-trans isomerase n=1 Tax=Geodermatophilus sp. TF02-6 TaxID=2250575 RepID=UPI0011BEBB59|nr:peptidyl-prolyl cis-trans isomerase [Geodermatophilus sp. TF02-6]
MQTRRLTASLAVGLAALAGVAGCRTSPGVAAYVGDEQVSVAELDTAVDQRLDDPALAAAVEGQEDQFTRLVLTRLVQAEVYDQVAQRYGVTTDDADVQALLDQLLGGQDPEAVYAQAATQGVGRADVVESVRERLVRERIVAAEDLADLGEQRLRQDYEQQLPALTQVRLGYVTVPDQAAADAAVATLQADPSAYPALAARYPGSTTLPEVSAGTPDQVPAPLADRVAAAAPNTAFSLPVPGVPGVLVVFVGDRLVPTFEEARPQLEQAAAEQADDAAQQRVADVRADLDITVNPRFGVIDDGTIVPADGGVVDVLGGSSDG